MTNTVYVEKANALIKESNDLIKMIADTKKSSSNMQEKPVIAVWGLMNVGKSYLLNMLSRHLDDEYFKTNDIRETAEVKELETDECIYLDTPGLDANSADNAEALKGVEQADVVLFVHQLQGELEQVEIDFLKNVTESFGDFSDSHIIMVISKIDKEDESKVLEIQDKILKQCQELLGFEPQCFLISNTRYHKGEKEHKNGLIHNSHILELKEHIESLLDESDIDELREQRLKQKLIGYFDRLEEIDDELEECQKEIFDPYYEALVEAHGILSDDIIPRLKEFKDEYDDV